MDSNVLTLQKSTLSGIDLGVWRGGAGKPVAVIASEDSLELDSQFLRDLAQQHEVFLIYPPGFGASARPDWITSPDDLAYICLDVLDHYKLSNVPVIGFSLGGWIAAEMAVKNDSAMSKLVLVDAYGVKIGDPYDVDILDLWTSHPDTVSAAKWHDQAKGRQDYTSKNDEELSVIARNIESFARFCWDPYMHNPKLKQRLHRIKTPTLVVWGEQDGVVTPAYGKAYADLIPGATFKTIANAGHFPHIEQPEAFGKVINDFLR